MRPPKLLIVQCRLFGDDPVAEPRCAAGSRSSNIIIDRPQRPSASVRPQPDFHEKEFPDFHEKEFREFRIGDGGQQAAPAGRSDRGSLR